MKKLISLLLSVCMVTTVLVGSVAAAPMEVQAESPAASSDLDRASGLVYGPWFGNGNEAWSTSIQGWAGYAGAIASTLVAFLPSVTAKAAAAKVASGALFIKGMGWEHEYTYGTVKKSYREVSYSDGSFAYFESKFIIDTTVVCTNGQEKKLGKVTEYYKGTSPMRLDN